MRTVSQGHYGGLEGKYPNQIRRYELEAIREVSREKMTTELNPVGMHTQGSSAEDQHGQRHRRELSPKVQARNETRGMDKGHRRLYNSC